MRLSTFLSASTLLLTHRKSPTSTSHFTPSPPPTSPHAQTLTSPLPVIVTKACYFNVHSTTVGTFKAQHSEPLDHNGAPQTLTGKYLTCSFSADLADGCIVTVETNVGCGNWTTKSAGGQES
ncbi:hypothetical protein BPAE_0116g00060 [Botrytis paeoniae]|uniref:Uncharacterized protein n=1 Tax=Botrytis paeoniae TaxID=278948 RepID=A0A4Z1FH38_9HELO|nr:hypothetical protein BPAE_0116g00060 [Botrytis paeoniae]